MVGYSCCSSPILLSFIIKLTGIKHTQLDGGEKKLKFVSVIKETP